MSSIPLPQILLNSLLDGQILAKAGEKTLATIEAHFTFTAHEITKAYQDSYGYAIAAISAGLAAPEQKLAFLRKYIHTKITREFADHIEINYLQKFALERGMQGNLAPLRKQLIEELKKAAELKDKLFEIEQITEEDLAALINYQGSFAITDLILTQMENSAPLDDTLAAFLRHKDLLGNAILFFFRELLRKDERLEKTQAALQREGLWVDVRNLQDELKTAEENIIKAVKENSPNLVESAQNLERLKQTQRVWQTRHEQLREFSRQFETWADLLNTQVDQVLADIGQLHGKLDNLHNDVKIILVKQDKLLAKFEQLMQRYNLSTRIKPRDELTQHNSTSLKEIEQSLNELALLPRRTPKYHRLAFMAGSVLSSTGDLAQAEQWLLQVRDTAPNRVDKALASFNLFQIRVRRKAYTDAFKDLQTAIELERQQYALHDVEKYPMLELLGAGGMGCVFLCWNQWRDNKVVVKCFWEAPKGPRESVFKEALTMYDVAGEYVPKPLDYGYVNADKMERSYFVTEYIEDALDGEAWLAKHGKLDLNLGLIVGLQVAQGLAVAHQKGIYHLDLKPANLLFKQTESGFSVKIIDFGLAQVAPNLKQQVVLSQRGSGKSLLIQEIFGTLDYAPPEQWGEKQYGQPGAKSDVFALGATLYHLFSGENPRFLHPSELPDVPELQILLLNCLKRYPEKRPGIQIVIMQLKQISFKKEGPEGIFFCNSLKAKISPSDSATNSALIESEITPSDNSALIEPKTAPFESATVAPEIATSDNSARIESKTATSDDSALIQPKTAPFESATAEPEIATSDNSATGEPEIAASDDSALIQPKTAPFDSATAEPEIATSDNSARIESKTATSDDSALIQPKTAPFDSATGEPEIAMSDNSALIQPKTAPFDSATVEPEIATSDNSARIEPKTATSHSATISQKICTLQEHYPAVTSVAFSPNGRLLASAREDGTIKLWDVKTRKVQRTLKIKTGILGLFQKKPTQGHHSIAFSPDGYTLASGSKDKTIRLWDVNNGKLLRTLTGHQLSVQSIAFSPDGYTLASGSKDKTIRLWDVSTGKIRRILQCDRSVLSIAFSLDGRTLAAGCVCFNYINIILWNVSTGKMHKALSHANNSVISVALSYDGRILASGSKDKTIMLWEVSSGKILRSLEGHRKHNRGEVYSVAFSPNERLLASGSGDHTIKLWDVFTGERLGTLQGHEDSVTSIAFSPDGNTLASGSKDTTIKLWR
jgi:WD40 repeat protein/tetratricopeptide (TPR) repeat protein